MTRIKNLRGECQHCGGRIEFHAEHAGTEAACPHCGQQTGLFLPSPPDSGPIIPVRSVVYTLIAVLILGGGLAGAIVALKRAQNRAALRAEALEKASAQNPLPVEPHSKVRAGFNVSAVALEKATGSSLTYATGAVTNSLGTRRFGVRIELELFNATGERVGTAGDYTGTMEAYAEWKYRAPVMESKAVKAEVIAVTED